MYCSSCGEEIKALNQKFCSNCGIEINIKNINFQNQIRSNPRLTQNNMRGKFSRSNQFIKNNQQNLYQPQSSTKFLIFPLLSFFFPIITFIVGGIYVFNVFWFDPFGELFYIFPTFNSMLAKMIFLMNLLGLIFGIKSQKYPPDNFSERCGKIIGKFGIIINAIALASFFLNILQIRTYLYF